MSQEKKTEKLISIRDFLGDTVIYGLLKISDKVIGFLLLPITTAILGPAEFGVLGLFITSSFLLYQLMSMGMPTSFFRFYTEKTDAEQARGTFATAFWLVTGYSALVWCVLLILARPLNQWLVGAEGTGFVLLLGTISYLKVIDALNNSRLQADGRAWTCFGIGMSSTLTMRGLGLALILVGWGVWGWVVGEIVGLCLAVLLFLAFFSMRGFGSTLDRKSAGAMAIYGALLVPAELAHWVMTASDKFFLRVLLDDPFHQIGLYTVGERISSVMVLVILSFLLGWRRFAFRNMHHEEGSILLARGSTIFALAAGYAALWLSLLGDDLVHWTIDPQFEAGVRVIPLLTAVAFFWGVGEIFGIGLHKAKKTIWISYLTVLAAVLNVALNFLLIPTFGILGAAWATLIGQASRMTLLWYFAQRAAPLPFEYRRLAIAGGVYLAVFGFGAFLNPDSIGWVASGITQTILVCVVPPLIIVLGLLRPEEREFVERVLASTIRRLRRESSGTREG